MQLVLLNFYFPLDNDKLINKLRRKSILDYIPKYVKRKSVVLTPIDP